MNFYLICVIVAFVGTQALGFIPSAKPRMRQLRFNSLFKATSVDLEPRTSPQQTEVKDVLPMAEVMKLQEVTDATFEAKVLQASGLSVVFFSSGWCSPCHDMKQTILSQVLPKHSSKATFFEVDTDYNTAITHDLNVRTIPSVLMIKDGVVVSDIVGRVDATVLNDQILKNF